MCPRSPITKNILAPRCPARMPRPSSRVTARACRRPIRATTRSSWRSGEGAVVEDVDGNVFLDCAAGIAVTGTGHSHPGRRQGDRRPGRTSTCTCPGRTSTTSSQVRLAEEIAAIVPIGARDGDVRSFFSNSGHRGDRSRAQAGALRDETVQHHRVPRLVSRPHARFARGNVEQVHPAEGLRPDDAGRLSRPVRQLLSLPGRPASPRPARRNA